MSVQDLNIPIQFLMLMAYVVTAFYIWQQTKYLAKQQKPDLYVQAFYGDNRFLASADNQTRIPDWHTIDQFDGKQLVIVVSNVGGVAATVAAIKTGSGIRSITINNIVTHLRIEPSQSRYFNIKDPSTLEDLSNITIYGFNRKNEVWRILPENVFIQSEEDPYKAIGH